MAKEKKNQSVMGRNLMILRKAHKLTQEQVADILKIKRSTYAYYERDITPTVENIKKLATLFGVSVHFLMYGCEEGENIFSIEMREKASAYQEEIQKYKLKDLKSDEAILLSWYKLLSSQNKEKIHKEIKELYEKSN